MHLHPAAAHPSIYEMTVASANPFALLDEEFVPRAKAELKAPAPAPATAAPVASKPKASGAHANPASRAPQVVRELNAAVPADGKTGENTRRRGPRRNPATEGAVSERVELKRTDRHSRTGRKHDGEKRMNGGKGSWGRATDAAPDAGAAPEQAAPASVSVEEGAEGVEGVETETAVETAPSQPARLTFAQYQAQLKKPVSVPALERRQVASLAADAQVIKKAEDVFVFPEIVRKKAVPGVSASSAAPAPAAIDLTKYLSIKSVPSQPSSSASPSDRPSAPGRGPRRDERRPYRTTSTSTSASTDATPAVHKLNLNDSRSFPTLGQ